MNYEEEYEREFVQFLVELIREKGMNHSQFALQALPNTSNAVGKWRRIRNVSPSGEPQKLSLTDAISMAKAIGKTYSEICWSVEQRLNAKGIAAV